ncbi:hypothetical protein H7Q97_13485 [Ochrobactrum sp. CM-21-5]|nr:hypothetical protein [Ochrobactrum sp. CM-21-5]
MELTLQGQLLAASTFKNMSVYTLVAIFYLSLSLQLMLAVGRPEKLFGKRKGH